MKRHTLNEENFTSEVAIAYTGYLLGYLSLQILGLMLHANNANKSSGIRLRSGWPAAAHLVK